MPKSEYSKRYIYMSAEQHEAVEAYRAELLSTLPSPFKVSLQIAGRLVIDAGLKALREQQEAEKNG